ncbi:phenylalanine tRNA synthtetase-like protein, partial [Thalassiosira pseudonana CCMP1335]
EPHPSNNITPHIASLVGRDLHLRPSHPIGIVRSKIQEYFASLKDDNNTIYKIFDAEDPIVTSQQCFDDLLIPPNHPGRAPSDTYYVTESTLLRTHTSAHQSQHLRSGVDAFLCCGDVYRRDEIDATHYPAFHQMEGGAEGLTREEWLKSTECQMVELDLKSTLEGLMDHLFGPTQKRWNEDYFPFTEPSFELEINHNDEWMEVLGCGVIHEQVLELSNRSDRRGWAFGLGLERLAMILFKIPDIRLFWTDDERFHSQFKEGKIAEFRSYSKYPPVFKDIAFWTKSTSDEFVENDFFDLVRSTAGDLVERIELIDHFTHPKTGRSSRCYRISYRSMDRSLTNEEIDELQFKLRD